MLKIFTSFHSKNSSAAQMRRLIWASGITCAKFLILLVLVLSLASCGLPFFSTKDGGRSYVVKGKRYHILASAKGFREKGVASWYGEPFHGRKTASGEIYDMNKITAAHKTLPLHTWVEVKNLENRQILNVRINDRGPFVNGRVIDLSRGAARLINILGPGTAKVSIRAITGSKAQQLAAAEQARLNLNLITSGDPALKKPTPRLALGLITTPITGKFD